MGTRADFYVGRGPDAEWLGSVAWDGCPDGIVPKDGWPDRAHLFDATCEADFRLRLQQYFHGREDVTLPAQGWPWPWKDSGTTNYAYAFDGGAVLACAFGREWFDPTKTEPEHEGPKTAVFPDMTARKNVTMGKRSGLIVVGPRGIVNEG